MYLLKGKLTVFIVRAYLVLTFLVWLRCSNHSNCYLKLPWSCIWSEFCVWGYKVKTNDWALLALENWWDTSVVWRTSGKSMCFSLWHLNCKEMLYDVHDCFTEHDREGRWFFFSVVESMRRHSSTMVPIVMYLIIISSSLHLFQTSTSWAQDLH